jgi:cell division septum initiation protein DivIVA
MIDEIQQENRQLRDQLSKMEVQLQNPNHSHLETNDAQPTSEQATQEMPLDHGLVQKILVIH